MRESFTGEIPLTADREVHGSFFFTGADKAFASIVECGSITRAAKKMGKDRTTVSELLEYLELDLGYALFERHCRPIALTERGNRLYRQARLFLHEAQAFNHIALQQQTTSPQSLTLSYDIFTPCHLLARLAGELYQQGIQLNLRYQDRHQAEQALEKGEVDIGLYQPVNKSVSERFKWRAMGSVELAVYASPDLFSLRPVSLLTLASCNQLIANNSLDAALARRIQIADRVQFINDRVVLRSLLASGQGWAMLPVHAVTSEDRAIERIVTEMGERGWCRPSWLSGSPVRPGTRY